jgi:cytochrome c biogenesis protein CcmG, thiol:disulfide interchange protein DsbE
LKFARAWLLVAAVLIAAAHTSFADSRDWSLLDTKGETFKLAETTGESPTLLIFWATWCAPCKKELSDNKALFQSFTDKGVNVIMVSEDNAKTQARVKPYVESKGFKWRVLLDTDGEILKRYGGTSIPYTVLLDKTGKAVQKYRGEVRDSDGLQKQISQLLGGTGE